jgi:dolichol kinase
VLGFSNSVLYLRRSHMFEVPQNTRYPTMYKFAKLLGVSFANVFLVGCGGTFLSAIGLIDIFYCPIFLFLLLCAFHLLSTSGFIAMIAIDPREYFIPTADREKKKNSRVGALIFSGGFLFLICFLFTKNYTGEIDGYLLITVVTVLVDCLCAVIYVYYGNGTRKMKLY